MLIRVRLNWGGSNFTGRIAVSDVSSTIRAVKDKVYQAVKSGSFGRKIVLSSFSLSKDGNTPLDDDIQLSTANIEEDALLHIMHGKKNSKKKREKTNNDHDGITTGPSQSTCISQASHNVSKRSLSTGSSSDEVNGGGQISFSCRKKKVAIAVQVPILIGLDIYTSTKILMQCQDHLSFFFEPLVARDSKVKDFPLVIIFMHATVLEAGFCPLVKGEPFIDAEMPEGSQNTASAYILNYRYLPDPETCCKICFVPLEGGLLAIHAGLTETKKKSSPPCNEGTTVVKASEFAMSLSRQSNQRLFELTKAKDLVFFVKNFFSYSILQSVNRETKETIPSLQGLPIEICDMILGHLDAKSICQLQQTCRRFRILTLNQAIWKQLCYDEYGKQIWGHEDIEEQIKRTQSVGNWKATYIKLFYYRKQSPDSFVRPSPVD